MKPGKDNLKVLMLAMAVLVSMSLAGAEGFGVYSLEKTKILDDGTAEFELLLVNTADQPRDLQVSASEIDGGGLWIEKGSLKRKVSGLSATVRIDSSKQVASGGDVVQLGDGSFVNTTALKLVFEAEDPEKDSFDFDLDLRQQFEAEERSNLSQDVVNVRTYSFTVAREEENIDTSQPRETDEQTGEDEDSQSSGTGGFQDFFQGVEDDLDIQFGDEEQPGEQEGGTQEDTATREEQSDRQEGPATGTETQRSEGEGPGKITYILGAGVVVSVLYLLRVM